MKHRTLALMLTAALSLTLLAGCAPKTEGGSSSDPGAGSSSAAGSQDSSVIIPPQADGSALGDPSVAPGEGDMGMDDGFQVPEETTYTLSRTDFTLFSAGDSYKLAVSFVPADQVKFTSDKESVATVAADGTVTAVAEGTAKVSATFTVDGAEQTLDCTVRVKFNKPNTSAKVDLAAFYETLAGKYEMSAGMTTVEGEMLTNTYPGLSDIATEQSVIYMSMMSMSMSEFALIQVKDAGDVQKVKDILQARIDAQIQGGAWYPAAIEAWEKNSRIIANGNYVMMAVSDKIDDIVTDFNALF